MKEQKNPLIRKHRKSKKQGYSESEAATLAQQWVAEPGTSEHQLGLALDINGATYDIYLWLQENSYKYGFIFRYPGNKTHILNGLYLISVSVLGALGCDIGEYGL